MDENVETVIYEDDGQETESPAEDAPILPDGWDGQGDIFDEDSWNESADGADTDGEDLQEWIAGELSEDPDGTEDPSTTGDGEDGEDFDAEADDPTTDRTQAGESHKLKFTAQVDHNDVDVEVDEAELPSLYQKAQVVDRVQARFNQQSTTVDKAAKLARGLGYQSADDMLMAAARNYRDTEIDRLVNDPEHPVHPDVAADIIDRRLSYLNFSVEEPDAPSEEDTDTLTEPGRDWSAEVAELLSARPDLEMTQLPDAVANAALRGGKRLVAAYRDYEDMQKQAVISALRKENTILKQNADSAARAPVRGVTGGGVIDARPKDDFLDGFNAEDW